MAMVPTRVDGQTVQDVSAAPMSAKSNTLTAKSSVTWFGPDGSTWDLTDLGSGAFLTQGVSGFGGAPRRVRSDDLANGGALYRGTVSGPRLITLPIYVSGVTQQDFVLRFRALVSAFTSTDTFGAGTLVVTRSDGTARQIDCYYTAGLEGAAESGLNHMQLAVQVMCPDPYWESTGEITVPFAYATSHSYLSPYLSVSSSQTLGNTSVTIDGSVRTWPTWQFTGPLGFVRVVRDDGAAFQITRQGRGAVAGEVWTVVTRPTEVAVTSSDGTNLMPYLNWPGANLFSLRPGFNGLALTLNGATPDSSAQLTYRPASDTP